MPDAPNLPTMVRTLQCAHLHKLNFRERARLEWAAYSVMRGRDADPKERDEQVRRVYPIWQRIMGPEPEDAA